jgi:hypothetical protein
MRRALAAVALKEVRALLPLWAVCTGLVLATRFVTFREYEGIAILAYGLGSCALGAHAFGHEYSHRTLAQALSQPLDRRWLLLVKLSTLVTFVTALGVAGYATILQDFDKPPAPPEVTARLVWTIAVVLAPAMTLLCRSTLAGAIFSASLPATIGLAGALIGIYRFDPDFGAVDRFQEAFFWRRMPVLFALAPVVGWRAFIRLEAIEGRGREFHWPEWLTLRGTGTTRGPVRQLIAKELRLQQMVFAIAAIYIAIASVALARQAVNPTFRADALVAITYMYVALLALLAGALASAEERQLRMLEPQLLLPMAAWRQWLVKVAVVLSVGALLAVFLPTSVMMFLRGPHGARIPWPHLLMTVAVLGSASLFVSSLTSSGVRAITACAPFVAAGMFLVSWSGAIARVVLREITGSATWPISRAVNGRIVVVILAVGFATLMLRFAHVNHRSGERSIGRTGAQLAATAAFIVLAGAVLTL